MRDPELALNYEKETSLPPSLTYILRKRYSCFVERFCAFKIEFWSFLSDPQHFRDVTYNRQMLYCVCTCTILSIYYHLFLYFKFSRVIFAVHYFQKFLLYVCERNVRNEWFKSYNETWIYLSEAALNPLPLLYHPLTFQPSLRLSSKTLREMHRIAGESCCLRVHKITMYVGAMF